MKKFTFLVSAFALFAGTMSAATLQVTSPEMNAATEGSLLNVMANIPDGELTTIEFNFDGETLDYSAEECIGFKLSGKQVGIERNCQCNCKQFETDRIQRHCLYNR